MLVRVKKAEDGILLRRVSILELFSLIGWFPDCWGVDTAKCDVLDIVLASSFVGNACSAFHVGPVCMAFLAAAFQPKPVRIDSIEIRDDSFDSSGSSSG